MANQDGDLLKTQKLMIYANDKYELGIGVVVAPGFRRRFRRRRVFVGLAPGAGVRSDVSPFRVFVRRWFAWVWWALFGMAPGSGVGFNY